MKKILIIGSGSTGLATACRCLDVKVANIIIVTAEDYHRSMYSELARVTNKTRKAFKDLNETLGEIKDNTAIHNSYKAKGKSKKHKKGFNNRTTFFP